MHLMFTSGCCCSLCVHSCAQLGVQDEMETLMSRIDLNDNGNIEFEEFAAGMLDWRQMQVHLLAPTTSYMYLYPYLAGYGFSWVGSPRASCSDMSSPQCLV